MNTILLIISGMFLCVVLFILFVLIALHLDKIEEKRCRERGVRYDRNY